MPLSEPSVHARRATRARELAERYPASAEPLRFIAAVVDEQARLEKHIAPFPSPRQAAEAAHIRADPAGMVAKLAQHSRPLIELVLREGPPPLRDVAQRLNEAGCREALDRFLRLEDTTSPGSFFARVLLQGLWASRPAHSGDASSEREPRTSSPPTSSCPGCGHAPQLGVVHPIGDGSELRLMCSLCLRQWSFSRQQCAACGESEEKRIAYYGADEKLPHLKVRVCESCLRYLVQVELMKEPKAVPDIDEMAALPLDVWATGRGLRKLHPNLFGI